MKMKQRIRHRKSRVIKTKSRKNRYRRTPKYKVGGGFELTGKYLREIRMFLVGKDVPAAEAEYRALYDEFAVDDETKTKYFDPKQTKGIFAKENRLRDILTKIKNMPSNETSRKVDDLADYMKLADALNELVTKKRAQRQAQSKAAQDKREQESVSYIRPDLESPKGQEKYYKIFIDPSKLLDIPEGLKIFESGTSNPNPVTKIPPQSVMSLSPESISKEEYAAIPGTPMTIRVGGIDGAQVYRYKRVSQNSVDDLDTVYYVDREAGNGHVNNILHKLFESFSSKKYEYRISGGMDLNCNSRKYTTKTVTLTSDKKQILDSLWNEANCLLKMYPKFFTSININNLKIVSPSGGTLTGLEILDGNTIYYSKGTFTGIFADGTTVVVEVYDLDHQEYLKSIS
jgi:hypothetical protein